MKLISSVILFMFIHSIAPAAPCDHKAEADEVTKIAVPKQYIFGALEISYK